MASCEIPKYLSQHHSKVPEDDWSRYMFEKGYIEVAPLNPIYARPCLCVQDCISHASTISTETDRARLGRALTWSYSNN